MNEAPLGLLLLLLFALIVLSAFFSSSETGMMSLNRYRLKHLANSGNRAARRANYLLERPQRLLGLMQIGNTLSVVLAAAVATIIALRLLSGALAVLAVGALLTLALLVFSITTPKTFAALYPERVALPFSRPLKLLLRLFSPLLWLIDAVAHGLLRLVGINPHQNRDEPLSQEEMRSIIDEAGQHIPERHQGTLLNILDLEQMTIDDVMVPRGDMVGLDLADDDVTLVKQLRDCEFTRLPVFKDDINNIVGVLHLRAVSRIIGEHDRLNRKALMKEVAEPYFVPEGNPLHTQLFNFQKQKERMAIVVDEYGVVQGLVTIEDILEEIVGEFSANLADPCEDILTQGDGSYLIDGSAGIRDINRTLEWQLPTDGPKTLNGLLLEHLEAFPDGPVGVRIEDYYFETLALQGNIVTQVRAHQIAEI